MVFSGAVSNGTIVYTLRCDIETLADDWHEQGFNFGKNSQAEGPIEWAAEFTGLKESTIRTYCSQGKIPHTKRGRRLWFERGALLAWLEGKRE